MARGVKTPTEAPADPQPTPPEYWDREFHKMRIRMMDDIDHLKLELQQAEALLSRFSEATKK